MKKSTLLLATITILVLIVLGFGGLKLFVEQKEYIEKSQKIEKELKVLEEDKFNTEKTRQEIRKLQLENEQQSLFLQALIIKFSSIVGVTVALSGAWVGLNQYFSARHNEQLDRLANDLNKLWDGLTSKDYKIRASSVAGLKHFLSPEKKEFHERVASALAVVGRLPDNTLVVTRTLTPVMEYAMRKIPNVMKKISWQGLKLDRPDFSKLDLSDFDLRDSDLRNANFSKAKLIKAKCNAAQFVGAIFDDAELCKANLEYADLANASFKNANLKGANLNDVKIMHMDLQGAKLQNAKFLKNAIDWRLSQNWRMAEFDNGIKDSLMKRYGPELTKPRVLMLLWEFFPVVSGGGWTAAYHLLKKLRMHGTDLIVMVPWPPSAVSYYEFGYELELIPVGVEQSSNKQTEKDESFSEYSWLRTSSYTSGLYDSAIENSVSIFDRVNEFTKRARKVAEEKKLEFDVIHAHDWVTFMAAESLSKEFDKPWVAHFHSTESDRRNRESSSSIKKVEQEACQKSHKIITPSKITRQRLIDDYEASENKIKVSPNCLSDEEDNKLTSGDFQSAKVVFMGRLAHQKGPDIFVEIAQKVQSTPNAPNLEFVMFGKGDMESELIEGEAIQGNQNPQSNPTFNHIIFNKVVPIKYNAPDHIELLGKRTRYEYDTKKFAELAFKNGFTAYAGDFTDSYTHRIQINNPNINFKHQDFLVEAQGLNKAKITKDQLVSLQGFIDWDKRRKAFENATLVIVPSRSEPFGMIVLEAMQAGVPVMFPETAGVSEVISSGIRINPDPQKFEEIAKEVVNILTEQAYWERVVEEQTNEIANYNEMKNYELEILNVWKDLI